MKLLNIDANPKTVKGQERGYMTAILYLSPYTLAGGPNICPTAEVAGCWRTCLNVAGHGGIPTGRWLAGNVPDNAVQRARLARTRLYHGSRGVFIARLLGEIYAFTRKAERKGLTPCVRLNGTSDILWERETDRDGFTLFSNFPRVQFYDYTKLPQRLTRDLPPNYHLSVSWSGKSARYQHAAEGLARATGAPLVVVDRAGFDKAGKLLESAWTRLGPIQARAGCLEIINGDAHDLRFTDPRHSLVVLKAKGLARRESNGFVLGSNAA